MSSDPKLVHWYFTNGKITVLLGPNGSDKSTLLRSLSGLNRAVGQLLLNGQDLMTMNFARRAKEVVYLPQSLPASVHYMCWNRLLLLNVLPAMLANRSINWK